MKKTNLSKFLLLLLLSKSLITQATDIAVTAYANVTVPVSVTFDGTYYQAHAYINRSMYDAAHAGNYALTSTSWLRAGYPENSTFNSTCLTDFCTTSSLEDGVTFQLFYNGSLYSSYTDKGPKSKQNFDAHFTLFQTCGSWTIRAVFTQFMGCYGSNQCNYFCYNNVSNPIPTPAISYGSGIMFCQGTTPINNFGVSYGYTTQNQYPRYVADVNGDGKGDVVAFGTGNVVVSLSNSTTNSTSFTTPSTWLANNYGIPQGWTNRDNHPRAMADVNGDGKSDIVGFANDGVAVSLSTGNSFTQSTFWVMAFNYNNGWYANDANPRIVTDMNNDGKSDIVGFANAGVAVALSTGAGFTQPVFWLNNQFCTATGWTNNTLYPRYIEDINNDGKKDIIGFANQGVYVALNTGTAFASPTFWTSEWGPNEGWTDLKKYPRYLSDIDNDGKLDIIGFANQGVYFSKNTGSSFLPKTALINNYFCVNSGYIDNNVNPRFLAKINNDNLPDIIGFADCGVMLSINNGSGGFNAPQYITNSSYGSASWISNDKNPRILANIDNDIRDEIIGFSNTDVLVSNGTCNSNTAFRTKNSDFSNSEIENNEVTLNQNYPNPFQDMTTIEYSINVKYSNAMIECTDILGRKVFEKPLPLSEGKLEITNSDLKTSNFVFLSIIVDGVKYKTITAVSNN